MFTVHGCEDWPMSQLHEEANQYLPIAAFDLWNDVRHLHRR